MILDRISSGLSGPPLLSGFILALVNMVPVVGVIMWDWGVFEIVSLYWAEALIVGAFNIPLMLMAKGGESSNAPVGQRMPLILFFLFHYGLFCGVLSFFVFFLSPSDPLHNLLTSGFDLFLIVIKGAGWAFFMFFLGHLFSFFWNFIGQREYRETVLKAQIWRPYGWIVILHIVILYGGFAVAMLEAPLILLLILVVGKTALDLGYHFYSHGREAGKPGFGAMTPA